MRKKHEFLILLIELALMSSLSFADPIIYAAYPNPLGTESGGEAIILFNPENKTINLSGYSIATELSDTDVIFDDSHFISPEAYFVIADSGWNESKDNITWPDADLKESITMYDTNSGIALINVSHEIIDAVGWGDESGIETGLYEPSSTANPSEGLFITRINTLNETNNNSQDFFMTMQWPIVQNIQTNNMTEGLNTSNISSIKDINVSISINNSVPFIESITIKEDDDDTTAGIQLYTNPGNIREVTVETIAGDLNGYTNIQNISIIYQESANQLSFFEEINSTHARYRGYIQIEYSKEPGLYELIGTVMDNTHTNTRTASYEIMKTTSIITDADKIDLFLNPGEDKLIAGDINLSTKESITLHNNGNTVSDIGIIMTDLRYNSNIISPENIRFSFIDNDFENEKSGYFNEELQIIQINLQPDEKKEMSLLIETPVGIKSGNYSGTISLFSITG